LEFSSIVSNYNPGKETLKSTVMSKVLRYLKL